MVFNATFNNITVISWQSVLLQEVTGVPAKKHRPAASHWQTWSHNVVSSTSRLRGIRSYNGQKTDNKTCKNQSGFQVHVVSKCIIFFHWQHQKQHNIVFYIVLCFLYQILPVSLDCSFLLAVRYSLTFV
jgi:hypothetical protein